MRAFIVHAVLFLLAFEGRGLSAPANSDDGGQTALSDGHVRSPKVFKTLASLLLASSDQVIGWQTSAQRPPLASQSRMSNSATSRLPIAGPPILQAPTVAASIPETKLGPFGRFRRLLSRNKPERAYASSETVADSYDSWTSDGILEYYWGDHIHLGYYPEGKARGVNFIKAKAELTKQLFEWSKANPTGNSAKLLDAGCGIGGSTRQLFRDYGFAEATGISLSKEQIRRATQLTTEPNVTFLQMDALNMDFADDTFDVVWSLEMEPHIPDKRKMVDELLRVLKPGGTLILGGWNVRDDSVIPLSPFEHRQMTHLLEEWSHPNFWSIAQYEKVFKSIPGVQVRVDDWSIKVHPSWMESITTMFKRPKGILMALTNPRRVPERVRDLYTLWDWHRAMGNGLMQFGVFAAIKPKK